MCNSPKLILPAMVLFTSASTIVAQTVTFELIPDTISANDMSPDGRYIVGNTFNSGPYLLDWETQTKTILPAPGIDAVAVSDDGTTVLGTIPDPDTGAYVAAIWTAANGWVSIGHLPNAQPCGLSSAYELSADGTVATGLSWDGCNALGFVWSEATGMVALEELANGVNRASVISGDGTLMGGFAQGSFSRTPTFWLDTTAGTLLDPPNGDHVGEIHGMSDAGTVLLGTWRPAADPVGRATSWTFPDLVPKQLGAGSVFPGWEGIPMDIADDATIVGFDTVSTLRRAWIMPQGKAPLLDLETWVIDHGGTIPDGLDLKVCQAISTDGSGIIGHGFPTEAWHITIQASCPWDCDGSDDGIVGINDFLALLAQWDTAGSCDFDGAGVGINDFLDLLANWGTCP